MSDFVNFTESLKYPIISSIESILNCTTCCAKYVDNEKEISSELLFFTILFLTTAYGQLFEQIRCFKRNNL